MYFSNFWVIYHMYNKKQDSSSMAQHLPIMCQALGSKYGYFYFLLQTHPHPPTPLPPTHKHTHGIKFIKYLSTCFQHLVYYSGFSKWTKLMSELIENEDLLEWLIGCDLSNPTLDVSWQKDQGSGGCSAGFLNSHYVVLDF